MISSKYNHLSHKCCKSSKLQSRLDIRIDDWAVETAVWRCYRKSFVFLACFGTNTYAQSAGLWQFSALLAQCSLLAGACVNLARGVMARLKKKVKKMYSLKKGWMFILYFVTLWGEGKHGEKLLMFEVLDCMKYCLCRKNMEFDSRSGPHLPGCLWSGPTVSQCRVSAVGWINFTECRWENFTA